MTAKTALKPCLCSSFEFGQYGPDGDAESYTSIDTNCNAMTHRIFAQGHDAKLAGFMVRAELDGLEIAQTSGGIRVTFPGATEAALSISEALARKVEMMLAAAKRRSERKSARAAKTPKVAPVAAPEPELVRAKVGRWTYEGAIGPVTGDFVYRSKLGAMKTAAKGKYTLV